MYLLTLSLVLILVITLIIYFEIKLLTFWRSHGIKLARLNYISVVKILCQVKNFTGISKDLYDEYKLQNEGVVALHVVGIPIVVVTSPNVVKLILDKDSQYFLDRGFYTNDDSISKNLFTISDDKSIQPSLREKLMPAFNAIHHDELHDYMTMYAANTLVPYLEQDAKFHLDINVTGLLERYTTRLMGCATENYCCPILNPNTELRRIALLLNTRQHRIKRLLSYLFPELFDKYKIKTIDPEVGKYFTHKIIDIITYRSRFFTGKPFFNAFFAKQIIDEAYRVNYDEVAACCAQMLEAHNTMAVTMSYLLYELSLNQDIQDELREEISTIYYRDNLKFRYDSIKEMHLMDRVISETLRKHPPLSTLHRITTQNYQLPSGARIPKGVRIIIPTIGFHYDPEYFPNPNKFDPNRFTEQPKPFIYLPFGEGCRKCVGVKLALHQMKICIAYLIRSYRFDVCDKTEIPLKHDSFSLWNVPETDVWLNISKAR